MKRQLTSAGKCGSLNHRNRWIAVPVQPRKHLFEQFMFDPAARFPVAEHLSEIEPGTKRIAGALKHENPQVIRAINLVQRAAEVVEHLPCEGIALGGTVQRNRGYRTYGADDDQRL